MSSRDSETGKLPPEFQLGSGLIEQQQPVLDDFSVEFNPSQRRGLERSNPDQLGKRLLEAAKQGDVMEAESLLLSNADIHYQAPITTEVHKRETGCMALHWAAINSRVEMITFLLQRGADINRQDDYEGGWTALRWASYKGKAESASILLHNKAPVDCRGEGGWTPLHCASWEGNVEVVAILLHHHADIHSKSDFGCTPLHYASEAGNTELVALLLHHNAEIHSQNKWTEECDNQKEP